MNLVPKFRLARRLGTWMIWILVAVGLLLRFTVRDRYFLPALVYYVTPIPTLPIWFLIAGLVGSPGTAWRRGDPTVASRSRLSPARLNLLMGLTCLAWAMWSQCGFRAGSASPGDFRLVFWNVGRVWASVPRLASEIKLWNASVVALVEADKNYRVNEAEWRSELPEYSVVSTHYGGLLAVKGTVASQEFHSLAANSWCEQFEIRLNDVEFTLLLVDIGADLRCSRREPLEALARLAERLRNRPLVIAGDFNTPDDSVWFMPLREHCRETFRERGTGYAATWPVPLPVLTLDQVWVNEQVNVSRCQHGWSACSDHRPVVSEISTRR